MPGPFRIPVLHRIYVMSLRSIQCLASRCQTLDSFPDHESYLTVADAEVLDLTVAEVTAGHDVKLADNTAGYVAGLQLGLACRSNHNLVSCFSTHLVAKTHHVSRLHPLSCTSYTINARPQPPKTRQLCGTTRPLSILASPKKPQWENPNITTMLHVRHPGALSLQSSVDSISVNPAVCPSPCNHCLLLASASTAANPHWNVAHARVARDTNKQKNKHPMLQYAGMATMHSLSMTHGHNPSCCLTPGKRVRPAANVRFAGGGSPV